MLLATRARTESLVHIEGQHVEALRARVVWANPDNVVNTERYDTDHVDDAVDGRSHANVCKPDLRYAVPRTFVQRGAIL
jgi:hypothetical protein